MSTKIIIPSLTGILAAFLATIAFSFISNPIVSEAQDTSAMQWEYLTISYSQFESYDRDSESGRYEIISSGDDYYAQQFANLLFAGCNITDVSTLLFDSEGQSCVAGNFLGTEEVLDMLGIDRWELVSVDNTSTEYVYHVDFIFKRLSLGG